MSQHEQLVFLYKYRFENNPNQKYFIIIILDLTYPKKNYNVFLKGFREWKGVKQKLKEFTRFQAQISY